MKGESDLTGQKEKGEKIGNKNKGNGSLLITSAQSN